MNEWTKSNTWMNEWKRINEGKGINEWMHEKE